MINSLFGITKEPFNRDNLNLLPQQKEALEMIKIHAQQGEFSVITGQPGVGESLLREHIEALAKERYIIVVSCSRALHTYVNILKQLAQSLKIDVPTNDLEKELILTAFHHVRERKTLYTVIDEAHLLDIQVLRKLKLLFDKFPKKTILFYWGNWIYCIIYP